MTILVAEDDQDQLDLRCSILERSGFITFAANDSASALQVAKERIVHCAVVDFKLPAESDSLQLIEKLKALQPAIHIVLLSGADLASLKHTNKGKFIDETFVKGSGTAELVNHLRTLANR